MVLKSQGSTNVTRRVEEVVKNRKRKRDIEEVGDIKGDISMGNVELLMEGNAEEDMRGGTKTSMRAKRVRGQALTTTNGGDGPSTTSCVVAPAKRQTRRKKNAGAEVKAKGTTIATSVTMEATRATRPNIAETNKEVEMAPVIVYSARAVGFHQPWTFPTGDIRSTLAFENHIERVAIELLLLRHRRRTVRMSG